MGYSMKHIWMRQPASKRSILSLRKRSRQRSGQAMVEYALIAALVAIALIAAVALTGPAIGNVFSNTVYNILGQTTTPYATLSTNQIGAYQTSIASYTFVAFP